MSSVNLGQLLVDMQQSIRQLVDKVQEIDPTFEIKPRTGPDRQSTDPYASTVRFVTGVVQEVIPFVDNYRVLLEGTGGAQLCGRAKTMGGQASGVGDFDTIGVGERVIVAIHRGQRTGYITHVLPGATLDRRLSLHDQISQASPDVRSADPYTTDLIARPTGELSDFSAAGPLDQGGAGEFTRSCAATGTGIHVDPYMAFVRASEETGVWVMVPDETLRMGGRSIQTWHPGGEYEVHTTAASTVSEFYGFTPYEWEALGAPNGSLTLAQNVDPIESQVTAPYKAGAEPAYPDQAPLYRFTEHVGAAVNGKREQVVAPLGSSTAVNRLGAPTPRTAFRDTVVGLDGGGYDLSLVGGERGMRPDLTAYAPLVRPEDVDPVTSDPPNPTPTGLLPDGVGSALVIDDLYAYRKWSADVGLRAAGYQSVSAGVTGEPVHSYTSLAEQYAFVDPEPVERLVYPGVGVQTYGRSSGDVTLPNGTRVIFGPCGEEIRMGGGVLELNAPTVVIRAGRDLLVLAGRDVSVRSHRDSEVASATGAVRIKADTDLHALAGNSGSGSLLLEGRSEIEAQDLSASSPVSGGVIIRSAANVVQYGKTFYTKATSTHVTEVDGPILQTADSARRFLINGAVDSYGPLAEPTATSYFGTQTHLGGNLLVTGQVVATGRGIFGDTIYVASGHIITADADQYDGRVLGLDDKGADELSEQLQTVSDSSDERTTGAGETYNQVLIETLQSPYAPGNDDAIETTVFGFRPASVIGAAGFVLYETRWQQKARLSGQSLGTWEESPVIGPGGGPTLPYPGYEVWSTACFNTVDLGLFDVTTGMPVQTDDLYLSASYPVPVAVTPAERYTVIR